MSLPGTTMPLRFYTYLPNMPNYALGAKICWPQAVEEKKNKGTFSIYPNPSTGTFTLQSPKAGTLRLMDVEGRVLMRRTVRSGPATVQVPTGITGGIYLVELELEDGNRTALRLRYEP